MGEKPSWKEYEKEIADHFRSEYPAATITANAKLVGRFSKTERQIDLLVEEQGSDFTFRIAVDAKHYSTPIDVKDVDQFCGMLRDIGVDVGVMISPEGYSQAAINRAHYGDSRLELDVLNFKDLEFFQGFRGIPYSGNCGVLMPAPFGWVLDIRQGGPWPACMYQRGVSLEEAMQAGEWMYVKFSKKDGAAPDLDALLRIQEAHVMAGLPDAQITFIDSVRRTDGAKTAIRVLNTPRYHTPEYTGFVEFKDFIFFCVLFSPVELEERNLRKLRYVVRKVLPLKMRFQQTETKS